MKHEFTDQVRRALAAAREHAVRLRHDYVGTEHLLLGLLDVEDGGAAAVLAALDVWPSEVRELVEGAARSGRATTVGPELPYTSRAKKTLEYAVAWARTLGSKEVGTAHLLLGMLREEKGLGAQSLAACGVTIERVLTALLRPESRAAVEREAGLVGPRRRGRARTAGEVPRRARHRAAGSKAAPASAIAESEAVWFLEVDPSSTEPIYEQIIAGIEEAVATDRLRPGERLPTVRQLAEELGVAPGTVARAYSHLERAGVLVTDGARGTRVAERRGGADSAEERSRALEQRLRQVAIRAYNMGASADEVRSALERAMAGIFE